MRSLWSKWFVSHAKHSPKWNTDGLVFLLVYFWTIQHTLKSTGVKKKEAKLYACRSYSSQFPAGLRRGLLEVEPKKKEIYPRKTWRKRCQTTCAWARSHMCMAKVLLPRWKKTSPVSLVQGPWHLLCNISELSWECLFQRGQDKPTLEVLFPYSIH